jgi:prevent-host-death family protein
METIGIREAKAHLSQLVQRAQRGDSVVLTHRGQPVAKIVPITSQDEDPEACIARLQRRGWIVDHTAAPVPLPTLDLEADLAQRILRQDRDAR